MFLNVKDARKNIKFEKHNEFIMKIIDKKLDIVEKDGKIILTQTVVWEYDRGQWERDKKGKLILYPYVQDTDTIAYQEKLSFEEIEIKDKLSNPFVDVDLMDEDSKKRLMSVRKNQVKLRRNDV